MSPLILRTATLILFPWIVLYSLYLLGRGHQNIGGGFIAGITVGLAVSLLYLGLGREFVDRAIRVNPLYLVAFGLLLGAGTGVAAILVGFPFLTSDFASVHLPFLGEVEFASAALFDVGVFFTVVGAVITIVATIGSDDRQEATVLKIKRNERRPSESDRTKVSDA